MLHTGEAGTNKVNEAERGYKQLGKERKKGRNGTKEQEQ
jgi:hypothetical protein